MAFTPATLNLSVDLVAGGGVRIYSYVTADAQAVVTVTDYFARATDKGLRNGDIVLVHQTSGGGTTYIGRVSAVDADGNGTLTVDQDFLQEYASKAAVEGVDIAGAVNAIRIQGYYAAGDGGGGLYKRVGSMPSTPARTQSLDGAWWQLGEALQNIRQFGAKGDGTTDDAAIFTSIPASLTVLVTDGTYLLNSNVSSSASFIFAANAALSGTGKLTADVQRSQMIYPAKRKNLGDIVRKIMHGDVVTIACYGDSLTYGWDTTATGTQPGINGSIVTRSSVNGWPEVMGLALFGAGYASVSVINRGFGGETVLDGYTRWKSASVTDVAIISYGTNDANGYPDSPVSTADFRRGYAAFIEQKIAQGSVVILTGAPTTSVEIIALQIRTYNEIIRELAHEYGLVYVDAEEQLRWMGEDRFTDGTHLTPAGYSDFGAGMSVLFLGHAGGNVIRVVAGDEFGPSTFPLFLGTDYAALSGLGIPLSRTGTVRHCGNGEFMLFSAFFEEDVYPIITTFTETTSGAQPFTIDSGALGSGGEQIIAQNLGASPYRNRVIGQRIPRGYRRITLTATGSGGLNVESLRFISTSDPYAHGSFGLWRKSACSGVMGPNTANESFSFIDYGNKLIAPFKIKADVKLYDSTAFSGLHLPQTMDQFSSAGVTHQILVGRSGTDLLVIVDGVTTTVGAAFAAGTFTGTLLVTHSGTQIKVYIDESAVAAATVANTANLEVFPGVRAEGAAPRVVCNAMILQD